jgi:hypothetical protein
MQKQPSMSHTISPPANVAACALRTCSPKVHDTAGPGDQRAGGDEDGQARPHEGPGQRSLLTGCTCSSSSTESEDVRTGKENASNLFDEDNQLLAANHYWCKTTAAYNCVALASSPRQKLPGSRRALATVNGYEQGR